MKTYYRARHILLEDQEDALEVLAMLKAKGDKHTFGELAQEYSECESASKGGNLGRFASGTMVAEFEKALYQLKEGEISTPVASKFGYHIIQRLPLNS